MTCLNIQNNPKNTKFKEQTRYKSLFYSVLEFTNYS